MLCQRNPAELTRRKQPSLHPRRPSEHADLAPAGRSRRIRISAASTRCLFNARVQATTIRAMDEPEPMPLFTFNPDGPTTITHPDGTVSVNAPRPDDTTVTTAPEPDGTAMGTADTPSTMSSPESADPQPEVTFTAPEPSGDTATPGTSTTASDADVPADAPGIREPTAWEATDPAPGASNSVVNPDGSITTRLPDGSTQTVVRLPGGATIVTSTTQPGAPSQPAPPDSPRSRRWRGRNR